MGPMRVTFIFTLVFLTVFSSFQISAQVLEISGLDEEYMLYRYSYLPDTFQRKLFHYTLKPEYRKDTVRIYSGKSKDTLLFEAIYRPAAAQSGTAFNIWSDNNNNEVITLKEWYDNGTLKRHIDSGQWLEFFFYENGQKYQQYALAANEDGIISGLQKASKEWFDDGTLKKENKQSGDTITSITYYENAAIRFLNKFRPGESMGYTGFYQSEYCDNGQLIYESYINFPHPSILYIRYYCNGQISAQADSTVRGAPSGMFIRYHENGNKEMEGLCINTSKDGRELAGSLEQGTWKYYDQYGNLARAVEYDYGEIIREKNYLKDGD